MTVHFGCIFDMDGTLLDSMGVWYKVDLDFFAKRGIDMPSDYASTVVAMPFEKIAHYTVERFHLPDAPEEVMAEWNTMAAFAYTHTVKPKPHAVDYVRYLHAHGVKLAIATSLPPSLRDPALAHAGILDCFDALCSTSDVARGKQHGDIYELAASKIGVETSRCVVFEDILSGISAAKSVGMRVWGVFDESSRGQWPQILDIADSAVIDFRDAPGVEIMEKITA